MEDEGSGMEVNFWNYNISRNTGKILVSLVFQSFSLESLFSRIVSNPKHFLKILCYGRQSSNRQEEIVDKDLASGENPSGIF